ncbi:AlkA N-terminal domain-containing protein, partial [Singulisphaera rosea]
MADRPLGASIPALGDDRSLDAERCYEAVLARDHRFDGRFFTAVRTTRLYCRPICPGRPKRDNVEFFIDAAGAEEAGYRPCLRCRPEDAPRSFGARGTRDEEPLSTTSVGQDINISLELHHRRRDRLDFSRKLVVETGLPLATIARISGFGTEADYTKAFDDRFRRPPSFLRRSRVESDVVDVELMLSYRPPLDWPALLGFFRHHVIHGLETVGEGTYGRMFELGSTSGAFQVSLDPAKPRMRLRVIADDPSVLFAVHRRVRRMFDLDADPISVGESLTAHTVLGPLWGKRPGIRIARGWDPFEVSVSTILGQLVSTTQARALVRQLVESYGKAAVHPSLYLPVSGSGNKERATGPKPQKRESMSRSSVAAGRRSVSRD